MEKNLSVFYKQPGFKIDGADIIVDNNFASWDWKNYHINFYNTPGHSNGSICFTIGNFIFTGDTIIKDKETVTKLPGGSKLKLKKSLNLLSILMNKNTIIMSGHGRSFRYK